MRDFIDVAISLVSQHGTEHCRADCVCIDGDIGFIAIGGQYALQWLVNHLLLSRGIVA